ncbi:hypothetical protein EON65_45780 [archaeon]|nr:MAG: hypothetical protein EON65_45780 [archaeon]
MSPPGVCLESRELSATPDMENLVDAVMASLQILVFMDGKIWSSYRGNEYIGGCFWFFVL